MKQNNIKEECSEDDHIDYINKLELKADKLRRNLDDKNESLDKLQSDFIQMNSLIQKYQGWNFEILSI